MLCHLFSGFRDLDGGGGGSGSSDFDSLSLGTGVGSTGPSFEFDCLSLGIDLGRVDPRTGLRGPFTPGLEAMDAASENDDGGEEDGASDAEGGDGSGRIR
jgi:hypothetical protein